MKRIFAHIGFSMAVVLIFLNVFPNMAGYFTGFIIVMLVLSLIIKKYRLALAVPISLGSALLACILFISFTSTADYIVKSLDGKTLVCNAYITDLPEKSNDKYVYKAKVSNIEFDGAPKNIDVKLKSDKIIDAEAYDKILCRVKFKSTGTNALDSYGYYSKNIYVTANVEEYTKTGKSVFNLNKYIIDLRKDIKNFFAVNMGNDRGALSCALLIGDVSEMSERAYSYFRSSGVTHLMAVSGLNTSILGGMLYVFLKRLRVNEKLNVSVVLLALVSYCALSGFTKSVIRSSIMLGVMLVAGVAKKQADALNSLGFSVFIICLNPFAAVDISALLSCSATLALLTVVKQATSYLPENLTYKNNRKIILFKIFIITAESVIVTVGVTLFTLPIMLLFFQTVSLSSILANIVLVPLANITMVLSLLAFLLNFIPVVSDILIFITDLSGKAIIEITEVFAGVKFSTVSISDTVFYIAVGTILLLFAFAFFFKNKYSLKIAAIISSLILVISSLSVFVMNDRSIYVRVSPSSYGSSSVVICNDDEYAVIGTGKSTYYDITDVASGKNKRVVLWIIPSYNKNECENAEKISRQCQVQNIVVPYENDAISMNLKCENIIINKNIGVDLWHGVNVKYKHNSNNDWKVIIEIYGKRIVFDNSKENCVSSCELFVSNNGKTTCENANCIVKKSPNKDELSIENGYMFAFSQNRQTIYRKDFEWER